MIHLLNSRGSLSRGLAASLVFATSLFGSSAARAAGWRRAGDLSVGRDVPTCATFEGRLFLAGGQTVQGDVWRTDTRPPVQYPPAIEEFEVASESWRSVGTMAKGRSYLTASETDSGVVFIGGARGGDPLFNVSALRSGTWNENEMPTARYGHASAFSLGRLFVTGGWANSVHFVPQPPSDNPGIDPYFPGSTLSVSSHVSTDGGLSWSVAESFPGRPAAWHMLTTLADGRLLLSGGCTGDGVLTSSAVMDLDGHWTSAPEMSMGRCRHSATLLNDGRVLVAGALGSGGSSTLPDAEIYDPIANRWSVAASMNHARTGHGAALLGDGRVLVAGGTSNQTNGELGALREVEIYDPATNTWTDAPSLLEARWWPCVAAVGGAIVVAGGENGTGSISVDRSSSDWVETRALRTTEIYGKDSLPAGGAPAGCACGLEDHRVRRETGALMALAGLLWALRRRRGMSPRRPFPRKEGGSGRYGGDPSATAG